MENERALNLPIWILVVGCFTSLPFPFRILVRMQFRSMSLFLFCVRYIIYSALLLPSSLPEESVDYAIQSSPNSEFLEDIERKCFPHVVASPSSIVQFVSEYFQWIPSVCICALVLFVEFRNTSSISVIWKPKNVLVNRTLRSDFFTRLLYLRQIGFIIVVIISSCQWLSFLVFSVFCLVGSLCRRQICSTRLCHETCTLVCHEKRMSYI